MPRNGNAEIFEQAKLKWRAELVRTRNLAVSTSVLGFTPLIRIVYPFTRLRGPRASSRTCSITQNLHRRSSNKYNLEPPLDHWRSSGLLLAEATKTRFPRHIEAESSLHLWAAIERLWRLRNKLSLSLSWGQQGSPNSHTRPKPHSIAMQGRMRLQEIIL